MLFASQLMTMFEFTPPGAEPLEDRSVIDHHGPALLIIAGFAILATVDRGLGRVEAGRDRRRRAWAASRS